MTHLSKKVRIFQSVARRALRPAVHACLPSWVGIYQGPSSQRRVCLTFDDGPHPEFTPAILQILKRYNAQATFFLLGGNASAYPHLVAHILEEGHSIGNHTQSHCNLSSADGKKIWRELTESCQAIEAAGGGPVSHLRPPWGKFGWRTVLTARRLRQKIVLWTVDSRDSHFNRADQIIDHIRNATLAPGSILLLHDDYKHTVEALPAVLEHLAQERLQCVTLAELLTLP